MMPLPMPKANVKLLQQAGVAGTATEVAPNKFEVTTTASSSLVFRLIKVPGND